MLIYSAFRLLFEASQVFTSFRVAFSTLQCRKELCLDLLGAMKQVNYIWSLINWIEVPLFILSVMFTIIVMALIGTKEAFCLSSWQWQLGVTVLWLSWIEFIFLSTQFCLIGVYALMFIRILKTMMKFIPLALLLIVAFGLTFHFLLYQPDLKVYYIVSAEYFTLTKL